MGRRCRHVSSVVYCRRLSPHSFWAPLGVGMEASGFEDVGMMAGLELSR
jgi:hypothetical protein